MNDFDEAATLFERASNDMSPSVFGRLLDAHRKWLHRLARAKLGAKVQAKFDASDIVQQTFLLAYRDRSSFRGASLPEFAAWLRRILFHCLSNQVRHFFRAEARCLERESRMDAESMQRESPRSVHAGCASPSELAIKEEESRRLARCLARLPPSSREVLLLRSFEGLPHDEVARRMGRSSAAARMLWLRALERLRREMSCTR